MMFSPDGRRPDVPSSPKLLLFISFGYSFIAFYRPLPRDRGLVLAI